MGGIFILFSVRLSISFLETFKVEKNFDDKDAERLSAVLGSLEAIAVSAIN